MLDTRPRRSRERAGGQRAGQADPVARREVLGAVSRHFGDRPAGGGDDVEPGRHRLGQHHPELLLPEHPGDIEGVEAAARHGKARQDQARCTGVDAGHLVVARCDDLDPVGQTQVAGVAAQTLLLGAAAHDHHPGKRRLLATRDQPVAQRGHCPEHVLMALLPHQPPRREHHVVGRRRHRPGGLAKALGVNSRRANQNALRRHPLQAQCRSSPFGHGKEEVGRLQHGAPVGLGLAVAVGVEKGKGLPHRLDQPEAAAVELRACRTRREPERQLLGVHDIGAGEPVGEPQVAVADHANGDIAQARAGEPIAERGGRDGGNAQ
jgi:hypothetical protein